MYAVRKQDITNVKKKFVLYSEFVRRYADTYIYIEFAITHSGIDGRSMSSGQHSISNPIRQLRRTTSAHKQGSAVVAAGVRLARTPRTLLAHYPQLHSLRNVKWLTIRLCITDKRTHPHTTAIPLILQSNLQVRFDWTNYIY